MRLADFIVANVEPILMEWEEFARSVWPGPVAGRRALRDHAAEMILAVARNMQTDRYEDRQDGAAAQRIDIASDLHAINRAKSGFDLRDLVAEYRALRTNVIRLWNASIPTPDEKYLEDIVRFNDAIDRLLAESVFCYVGQVNKSREKFLAILGHDLRNPLHAVTLQCAMLAQSEKLDLASKMTVDRIFASVTAMGRMVGDLLDFTGSQLGSGMNISPVSMSLVELCKEVIDEMKTIHPERAFNFETVGEVEGEWDRSRLRQLISNLLGNALQHGCPDSPVMISIRRTDDLVSLAVSNGGPAIAPEALPLIFEPLKRVATPNDSRPVGSIGLGLYIAREVATAHGGSIDVQSTDERTTFTARMPCRRIK
jgi:signal transduction histidine kinase